MKNFKSPQLLNAMLALVALLFFSFSSMAQTVMFDDFNYSGINDNQFSTFNKWNIVSGISGPPEGGQYSRNNVGFINDPANPSNRLMTLSTTVNGATKATTHARVEAAGYEYFEGTYAARVYFSDVPFTYKDANIQTFYTIVSSSLAQDGSKYSELDIAEYMAADKWGISPNNPVLYTTSYHKYIAVPWTPWKTYDAITGSQAGWHTFVASCTDGVNIRYFMDGNLIATHSVTDSETQAGLPVYPRSNMHVAFANWIWNNVTGASTANRTTTMQVDWTAYFKNQDLSPAQVEAQITAFRAEGLQRRNLVGQTHYGTVTPPPPPSFSKLIQAESYNAMQGVQLEGTTDVDGGQNVGWIDNTDWMSYYDINIPTTGQYLVEYRVASPESSGIVALDLNGGAISLGSVSVPNTGGWQNWTTISHTVNIDAGTYNVGIYASSGGFNLNWFRISSVSNATNAQAEADEFGKDIIIYPNPAFSRINFSSNDHLGATLQILDADGISQIKSVVSADGLDISSLKPGLYTLVITTKGEQIMERFIKQ